jgi:histone-lysine N-methyltransferase SETMAR
VQPYDHSSNTSAESGRKETRFILQNDNARPHCSAHTQDAMTSLKFTMVLHPSYSPDLVPSDFWLFPKLNETLKGQHFSSSEAEVEASVRKWISIQPETFFVDGMKKWIAPIAKMCTHKW